MPDSLTSTIQPVVGPQQADSTAHQAAGNQAADSIAGVRIPTPFAIATDTSVCRETDAPFLVSEPFRVREPGAYTSGIIPEPRPQLPGYDSSIICMILAVFVFMALSFRNNAGYFKNMMQDLLTVRRRRTNAFDDPTVNERGITVSLVALACLCEGLLLFSNVGSVDFLPSGAIFLQAVFFIALAVVYYVFQLVAYSTVANVFAGRYEYRQWLRGFNASQSLLGLFLTVPALMSLFNPALAPIIGMVAAGLYALARIIFISKGFRIFYTNLFSSVYFILYLCTLEIVPPYFIYRTCISLEFLNL